jgi:hypothetical protein
MQHENNNNNNENSLNKEIEEIQYSTPFKV